MLIDEIDKAPRDFPNDLLHELDQHSFPHPFVQDEPITPRSGRPPIVIITSNEERRLPDAFLRRCIFHRIELTEELLATLTQAGLQARRDRIALINWLLRCDTLGDDGMPPRHSLARRALDWWRRRYREAAHKKKNEKNPLLPWKDSLASRRWELEQALLQLYSAPETAAEHLAQLADDELREEVRERLSEFAAAEHRSNGSGDDTYRYGS